MIYKVHSNSNKYLKLKQKINKTWEVFIKKIILNKLIQIKWLNQTKQEYLKIVICCKSLMLDWNKKIKRV